MKGTSLSNLSLITLSIFVVICQPSRLGLKIPDSALASPHLLSLENQLYQLQPATKREDPDYPDNLVLEVADRELLLPRRMVEDRLANPLAPGHQV
jgi:hypothetical protein